MVFLNALQSMASITIISLIGYILARKGWVSTETEIFIPKLVTQVVLPPYLMGNVAMNFQRDQLLQLIVGSIIPFVSIVAACLLYLLVAVIFRVDKKHRRLLAVAAATSNTIFIGVPVNTALFGDGAMTQVLLYFFGNTVFFWTLGNFLIASEGTQNNERPSAGTILKRIFSPPLCGMLTGVAIVLLDIQLPRVITDTCRYLGNLATPMALLFIGMILKHIEWKKVRMGKDLVLGILLRFVVSPLVLVACLMILPVELPQIQQHVYIIQSSLPSMTNIALISAYYGADREYGSIYTALTTICGMITVPAWMAIITTYF